MTEISSRQSSRVNPYFLSGGYDGPFKVSLLTAEIESVETQVVTVESGVLQMGSGNIDIAKEVEFPIDLENDGTLFIYFHAYSKLLFGGETVVYEYISSLTRPTIELIDVEGVDRWAFPVVVGKVTVTSGVASNLKQVQISNAVVFGCLS